MDVTGAKTVDGTPKFLVSVVVLNYNAAAWIPRCLDTLKAQTIFPQIEVIFADNQSTDGSDKQGQAAIQTWSNARFVDNACNPGFGGGINRAVEAAQGEFLFFLNPDVWLEPDCVEQLYKRAVQAGAGAAGLFVMDYENDQVQSRGATSIDWTGHCVDSMQRVPDRLFLAHGFCFVRRDLFKRVGGYDECYFLYGEEFDLCWRIWIAGESIVHAPLARIHHRGAVAVNPKGGTKVVEMRTSDSKRFYANRNQLLTLLKNSQHLFLLFATTSMLLLAAEGLVGSVLLRRLSFFKRVCLDPMADCWRLRRHILQERRKVTAFRRRGDLWFLRFLTWRFSRWEDYARIRRLGLPKVDQR